MYFKLLVESRASVWIVSVGSSDQIAPTLLSSSSSLRSASIPKSLAPVQKGTRMTQWERVLCEGPETATFGAAESWLRKPHGDGNWHGQI